MIENSERFKSLDDSVTTIDSDFWTSHEANTK